MAEHDDIRKTDRDPDLGSTGNSEIAPDDSFSGPHGDPAEGGRDQGLSGQDVTGDVGDDAITGHTGDDAALGAGADHVSAPGSAGSDRLQGEAGPSGVESIEQKGQGTGENRSFSGAGVGGRLSPDDDENLTTGIQGGTDTSRGKGSAI
jgi:hypothetical protein